MTALLWTTEFLESRGLRDPDGRPLYAYRCTPAEFDALGDVLREAGTAISDHHFRAFVLYAAQWWQRQYDGGRWAWEPLLHTIGWPTHYTELYPGVGRAWQWWKVKPVRLPSGTRYLGTFACHGGLPLALVGDASAPITLYLRSVLSHSLEYRRFVEDAMELAKDKQHLLRPPTLRRDHVFRLAADLVDAVLDLQPHAQGKDPIASLDRDRPEWRDAMPLDLDNALARDLVLGLLRDATQVGEMHIDDFSVRRFLRRTSIGWRLGARIHLPRTVSDRVLASKVGATGGLPARLEVRVSAKGMRVLGVYDHSGGEDDEDGEYRLAGGRAQLELWDEEAAEELRLRFLAGDYIGDGFVPKGGANLSELPATFTADEHERRFIGDGSVRSRAPEVVVLMPCGCVQQLDGAVREGDVLGRASWRTRNVVTIETEFGACVIHPGVQEQLADDYSFRGDRWYGAECVQPIYNGVPELRVSRSGSPPKHVPADEVQWRQQAGDWQQQPPSRGLCQIRHIVRGELRYFCRIGILPKRMALELRPGGNVGEGCVDLTGAEGLLAWTNDANMDIRKVDDTLRVKLKATDPLRPPTTVKLKLHWPGTSELVVAVPFPGRGGHFLREGELAQRAIAAAELYGIRAVALSPLPSDRFWVEGELRAHDLGRLNRVAHFRKPLRRRGALNELPLVDTAELIELLLSASSSSHAHVELRIVNGAGQSQCELTVSRFAAALQHNAADAFVEMSPPPEDGSSWSFHALSVAHPGRDPVTLETGGKPDSQIAALPLDLRLDEPWLAIAKRDGRVAAQPAHLFRPRSVATEVRDTPAPLTLAEAAKVTQLDQRRSAVQRALQRMIEVGEEDDMGEEWEFLTDTLLATADLPASSVDVLVGLTKTPRLLVRCLFRLDSVPRRRLWHLERELPFSWLLVKRDVWWQESKAYFDVVRDALLEAGQDDAEETALGHVRAALAAGTQSNAGLEPVAYDLALRLSDAKLSPEFVAEKQQARDAVTSPQIILRNSLDDWPAGDGRTQWTEEIGYASVLKEFWQDANQLGHRQPLFDTPVAAACYSLLAPEPTRRAVYLVRRMRTHDQDWFDLAYGAAWARLAVLLDGIKGKHDH